MPRAGANFAQLLRGAHGARRPLSVRTAAARCTRMYNPRAVQRCARIMEANCIVLLKEMHNVEKTLRAYLL